MIDYLHGIFSTGFARSIDQRPSTRATRRWTRNMRAHSLDHLVGALLEKQRYVEAKRFGGLEIDHQFVFGWRLHRKVGRLLAPEDAIDIGRRNPKLIALDTSVRHQAAEFSEEAPRIDSRQIVASSQRDNLCAMDIQETIRHHDQATIQPASLCGNDGFEVGLVVNRCGDRLECEGCSGGFEWVQVNVPVWRRCRIEQESGPVDAWRNLLEQLQPLAGDRRLHNGETGSVAAGPRQALDEAAADRIGNDYK